MPSFTLSASSVKKKLSPIFSIINYSTVLPILEDVLVTNKGKLSFTTTDLENELTMQIEPLHQEGDISFCLDGKAFKQLLNNSLSDTLSFRPEGHKIKIKDGDFSLSWPLERVDEYPKCRVVQSNVITTIDLKDILHHFNNALKFSSDNDLRPALTGVSMLDWNDSIYIVATDAHRLYFGEVMKTPMNLKGVNLIIPKKGVIIILQAFSKGPANIRFDANNIEFLQGDTRLVSRLIDAKYPEWQNVIPDNDIEFFMNRKQLLSFLKMAYLFVNCSTNKVLLSIDNNGITATGGDLDWDTEFNYKMPIYNCNKKFKAFKFGVNLRFLMTTVSISKDEYCKFTHSGLPTKAMIIDGCCILMPLMLNEIN